MGILDFLLFVFALVLLVPCGVLFVQCVLGSLSFSTGSRKPAAAEGNSDVAVAVLMPAHNEQEIVAKSVRSVLPQLTSNDRILVVADNCTDETAQRAIDAGAEVTERSDDQRRGKGWALDHGIQQLAGNPPDVVVFMDSDCFAGPDLIQTLTQRASSTGRPIQADYRLVAPQADPDAGAMTRFAWRLKDTIRPLGFSKLGLPCQLGGSGMAIPWSIASTAPLAGSDLVEDLKLGLDLAESGHAPLFEPSVFVDSELPPAQTAQDSQKERWVQGHLMTVATRVVPMLGTAIKRRDVGVAALALDLAVLPLGLLVMLLVAGIVLSAVIAALTSSAVALATFFLGLCLVIGAVLFTWAMAGRDLVSASDLFGFGVRLLKKIPLYAGVIFNRQKNWVRTDRNSDD